MTFAEHLAQPTAVEPSHSRDKRTWDFITEPAPHDFNTQSVTLVAGAELKSEDDWTQAVKDMGGIVADGYRVRLVEMRHNTHGWSRKAQGQDALTTGTWFYRFMVEPIAGQYDVSELVASIGRRKAASSPSTGDSVFHYLAGDLQLAKQDGDGTEGIVDRYIQSVDVAVTELKALRKVRGVGLAHIAFLGDCIEGNQSQNGRNMWRTQLTITEQIRLLRRLMLYTVDAFAPLVERVQMDTVNGNHDQVQRFQETRPDDGHATEAAIALSDAMKMNPAGYGHVEVFVPKLDHSYMTREIGSSVFTMAHGHQWPRGKGMTWWSGQALNWHAPGSAHFLLHGHTHTFSVDTKRDRTIICTPTFEGESAWWREKTGDLARRGAVTFTSRAGEFRDLRIV